MLGFSIPKILLLSFISLVVWYGFKIIEKRTSIKKDKSAESDGEINSGKYKADSVQDLEKCPKCSNYFMPGSKCPECKQS